MTGPDTLFASLKLAKSNQQPYGNLAEYWGNDAEFYVMVPYSLNPAKELGLLCLSALYGNTELPSLICSAT